MSDTTYSSDDPASVRMQELADVDDDQGAALGPAAPESEPVPWLAGTFAIYEDGQGGYVLVTETAGGIDRRHIPAAMVKLATGGGIVGRKFASLFGGN